MEGHDECKAYIAVLRAMDAHSRDYCFWLPSEKGCTLKGKNLLPRGENSFLLEYTPFQKRGKTILTEWLPLKVFPVPLSALSFDRLL